MPIDIQHLLQALALQQWLYGVAWWLAGRLRPETRRASVHWTAFSAVSAGALLLVVSRPMLHPLIGISLAIWLMLASFVLVRRGAELFFNLHPSDGEHLATLALMAMALAWAGNGMAGTALRTLAFATLSGWVVLRGVQRVHIPMRNEFGAALAWLTHLPVLVAVLLLAGRTGWAMSQPVEHMSLEHALFSGETVAYGLQIAIASLHFAYAGMLATRLSRGLLHLSQHDGMTGLYNRVAAGQRLEEEWQRHLRSGESFALLMVDADHFKRINDEHGHPAGDEVLVQLAGLLQHGCRAVDTAARVGGEEFLLLMPATDAAGAQAAAERLRQTVQNHFAMQATEALRLTVSVGWTLAGGADAGGQAVLARADRALYMAKTAGRNRVCSLLPTAPEPVPSPQPDGGPPRPLTGAA